MAQHGTVDIGALRELYDEMQSSGSGDRPDFQWYDFDAGKHRIRILPPWKVGMNVPAMRIWKHWEMPNPENPGGGRIAHVCVKRTFPEMQAPCPICDMLARVRSAAPDIDLGRWWPRMKAFVNALVREKQNLRGEIVSLPDGVDLTTVCIVGLSQ